MTVIDACLTIAGASTVLTFLHLLLNIAARRRIPLTAAQVGERVAVMIPMRNEERNAAAVVNSVLAQQGIADLRVLVCDDNSSDATAAAVAAIAEREPRVTLLRGVQPPQQWLGKPWACRQLREAAGDADVLVFIDADVRLHPQAVAAGVVALRRHRLDLLSPFPRQEYSGFWLSLFQPLLQWSILAMLPLRVMELRARWKIFTSLAAANGQFLIIDSVAYDRAGGHDAVRSQVVEDVMLARAIKAAGGKVTLTPAPTLASCRMYETNTDFVTGYTKSMWAAFGNPLGGLGVAATFLIQYLLPWFGLFTTATGSIAWWACIGAIAAGVIGRLATATLVRDAVWPAFLHPLSILVFCWLMLESLRRKATGNLRWKGRVI